MSKEQLFKEFQPSSKADWQAKAVQDLRAKPLQELQSNWFGLDIEPYNTREDILASDKIVPVRRRVSGWINYVSITVKEEKEANKVARKSLMLGATGIYFILTQPCNFENLLEKIDLSACAVGFDGQFNIEDYLRYAEQTTTIDQLSGFVNSTRPSQVKNTVKFHSTLIADENENELKTMTNMLIQQYHLMEKVSEVEAAITIKNMAYKLTMGCNYFFGIAKIRAFRILLTKFFQGYQINLPTEEFTLICQSQFWLNKEYAPHENMLKATTAAMAAIIGGCNALIIDSGDDDEQERLVARNISSMLEFESFLDKVADPVAGSYFLENLTEKIVNRVWQDFTATVD